MPDQDDQRREPQNREERRRAAFGPSGRDTGAVPGDAPGTPSEAVVQTSNQGTLKTTGAGTGGATETDRRQPEHEGVEPGRPNG